MADAIEDSTCIRLVGVLTDQPLPSLPVWLSTHRELTSSKRIRTVCDFLRKTWRMQPVNEDKNRCI
ncbi:MAG: hypothetical protein Q7R66_03760 [Undibacterium sp.]|uniref:hypothetical protein n=1 Tax=Undibacterium sp. TaxID=1914977 RepID=UPI002719D367|nr:hypothetical protein [Undibacterium sp.]MDO8651285.1 hypothetical protein [Undibacterium sp.]